MTHEETGDVFFIWDSAYEYEDGELVPVDFPGWDGDDEEYWDARASQARGEAGCGE